MLDTKYGMKYSMPHTVVHIVDNSAFAGELPVTIVDDPSLLATIVVTGAPMGEDNRIININRSDVLNVAYGMRDLTSADIEKYGQSVTYPLALLAQDVPIKFMRITPSDATYAFSCLLIQWRWDDIEHKMHVRYKTTSGTDDKGLPNMILSNFKNVKKLNEALVRANKKDEVILDDGKPWTQRVFMTMISAGRGSEYNKFCYAINPTNQPKRPANAKYNFITINTQNDQTYESFYASLINQNNGSRTDAIDSVNVAVSKRVQGSSILVPTVNELAVKELYASYSSYLKQMISAGIDPEGSTVRWAEDVSKLLNINIFDPIYGRYIYNGDTDVYLPYFQVDMYNLDIPELPETQRVSAYVPAENLSTYRDNPTVLNAKINSLTYGINRDADLSADKKDSIHVGDVYLSTSSNSGISLVTSINQYTGSITTIPITQVYPYNGETVDRTGETGIYQIKAVVTVDELDSDSKIAAEVKSLIDKRKIIPETVADDPSTYVPDYVAVIVNNASTANATTGLNIFTFAKVEYSYNNPDWTVTATPISDKAIMYQMLKYPDTAVGSLAISSNTATPEGQFFNSPGATVIAMSVDGVEAGTVYVNGYYKDPSTGLIADKYIINTDKPFVVGTLPNYAPVTSDMVGVSYDLSIYADNGQQGSNVTWTVDGGTAATMTGIEAGDFITIADINTLYHATSTSAVDVYVYTAAGDPPTSIRCAYANDDMVTPGSVNSNGVYRLVASEPADFNPTGFYKLVVTDQAATFVSGTDGEAWAANTWYTSIGSASVTATIDIAESDITVSSDMTNPTVIQRYVIAGTQGSLYRYAQDPTSIPNNYYSDSYGINPNSELGGINIEYGYTGFFDDEISSVEYKWRYSKLLVDAYKGENGFDPRIKSPVRVPAKFLFDGATNTVVGQTLLPYMTYNVIDIINASTIFTDDEKEACVLDASIYKNLKYEDIDVKQAMYDLMEYRCYYGMPEDKRPIGPGFGLSLHLDSGVVDGNTAQLVNQSFAKRFDNPNASWDIGGFVSTADGIAYTYTKRLVDNMFNHIRNTSINVPFTGQVSAIGINEYSSYFPDIDVVDWDDREALYKSGGNAWIVDINGNLKRSSQRTLNRASDTSDLIQESNMRTLSQLCYLLQNKIENYLFAYNDDGVLKTLKDECDNMFSNWIGDLVTTLDITFKRDLNPTDGGEIVVCYVKVTFRGLILRVPIIVDVQRRANVES